MGIVYEAYDRHRDETVALKTLATVNPVAIYRFKKEFRALADVAHENLVSLYELFAEESSWFFTMELIVGQTFLEYVRPGFSTNRLESNAPTVEGLPAFLRGSGKSRQEPSGVLDTSRLEAAFRQLAEGIAVLHQVGKVHRDIKPSNVLVRENGQVVVLDFGLAADLVGRGSFWGGDGISGTIEYMAPEHCRGMPCTPASDWYSVGVILYQALSGRLPHEGSRLSILSEKQKVDPPRLDELGETLPVELIEICHSLLEREPRNRMTADELMRRLGVSELTPVISPALLQTTSKLFSGRSDLLRKLEEAFRMAAGGQAVFACVYGPSGIGKTTLVKRFTDDLTFTERALVLRGRCFLSESVPYKAFDGVVDQLTRLLKEMDEEQLEALLPRDVGPLAQAFPVFKGIERADQTPSLLLDRLDRKQLRRRAFHSLGELLANLSRIRVVVVHIDDLQWADVESVELWQELLGAAGLRMLLIGSFRGEEVAHVPFLKSLIESTRRSESRFDLELGPLRKDEALELAEAVMSPTTELERALVQRIAIESGGNPFLLDQMARFLLETRPKEAVSTAFAEMLSARQRQLPEGTESLLQVLAVAAKPIDARVAYRAAGLRGDERPMVASLRIVHFLRPASKENQIELYHDRFREHYAAGISEYAKRDIHGRIAESLEAMAVEDPESLYEHYLGAGSAIKAARYAARSAEVALAALAFERAARSYQRAIELSEGAGKEVASWLEGLGDALASSGRGGDAATSYLSAASMRTGQGALDLERRAGEQLLISGRTVEGLEVVRRVLGRVGLRLAPGPRRALVSLVLRRLRLRLRGLAFRERRADEVPSDDLTRIDICWAVAEGLAFVDNIQGAAFQTLHLLLALRAGEPHRIARALAIEAGFAASAGRDRESRELLAAAETLANRLGSSYAVGLCSLMASIGAYYGAQWRTSLVKAREAESILKEHASFVAWHLSIAKLYQIQSLFCLGEVADLARLSQAFLGEALDSGNVFETAVFQSGWCNLPWLCADDVSGARRALMEAENVCSSERFHIPNYFCMLARGQIDLYAGVPEKSLAYIDEIWPRLKRSMLLRIRTIRAHSIHLRARCALSAARKGKSGNKLLSIAERGGRDLEREGALWCVSMAGLVQAGVAASMDDRSRSLKLLEAAADGFARCEMPLWLAVTRRRQGELLGGADGRALVESSNEWMTSQSIQEPSRWTETFAPGF